MPSAPDASFPARAKTFHGGDRSPGKGDDKLEAGIHALPVDDDGAGAALAMGASLLGGGQFEVAAQEVEECRPGMDIQRIGRAVDRNGEGTGG